MSIIRQAVATGSSYLGAGLLIVESSEVTGGERSVNEQSRYARRNISRFEMRDGNCDGRGLGAASHLPPTIQALSCTHSCIVQSVNRRIARRLPCHVDSSRSTSGSPMTRLLLPTVASPTPVWSTIAIQIPDAMAATFRGHWRLVAASLGDVWLASVCPLPRRACSLTLALSLAPEVSI